VSFCENADERSDIGVFAKGHTGARFALYIGFLGNNVQPVPALQGST
jgi:hypothetical protein